MLIHIDKSDKSRDSSHSDNKSQRQDSSKTAFEFMDNSPEAIVQMKLQDAVDNSPQAKRTAQFQAMANKHSASLRQNNNISEENIIQRIKSKESDPKTNFIDKEKDGSRAGKVVGQAISPQNGGVPSVNPVGWAALVNNVTKIKGTWVRFHLINQFLGGPGNKTWNLVPTTVQTNHRSDWKKFEKAAQDALYDDGESVFVSVEVEYPNNKSGFPSRIQGTAESYNALDDWNTLGVDVDFKLSQPQLGKGGQVVLYAGELTSTQWELGVGMPNAVALEVVKIASAATGVDDLVESIEDIAWTKDRSSMDWSIKTLELVEKNIRSAASGKRTKNLCIQF